MWWQINKLPYVLQWWTVCWLLIAHFSSAQSTTSKPNRSIISVSVHFSIYDNQSTEVVVVSMKCINKLIRMIFVLNKISWKCEWSCRQKIRREAEKEWSLVCLLFFSLSSTDIQTSRLIDSMYVSTFFSHLKNSIHEQSIEGQWISRRVCACACVRDERLMHTHNLSYEIYFIIHYSLLFTATFPKKRAYIIFKDSGRNWNSVPLIMPKQHTKHNTVILITKKNYKIFDTIFLLVLNLTLWPKR